MSEHKQRESKEAKNTYQREWRANNPDKCKGYAEKRDKEEQREKAWGRRYGITREDYDNMFKSQGGVCDICSTSEIGRDHEYFHVDHNHDTGKVRGLLCDKCNRGLGYFNDNFAILELAAAYLRNHEDNKN